MPCSDRPAAPFSSRSFPIRAVKRPHCFSFRAVACCLTMCLVLPARAQSDPVAAAEPTWWAGIWSGTRATTDHAAPINVGQLKHVASRALAFADERCTAEGVTSQTNPEASAALESFRAMVNAWPTGPSADNAAPVPVGALKVTAAKFHDVLAALGYPLMEGAVEADVAARENGLTDPPRYPWWPAAALEDLKAPANVGQLKMAFRAPHPGLVASNLTLNGALTIGDTGLADDGSPASEQIPLTSIPVWGTPRMAPVTSAEGAPVLPVEARLARPTALRFSPWLAPVRFKGVVSFTAVAHQVGGTTTWIPVVASGVLAANTALPYSPGKSAVFKAGTFVEFAHVATRRDRPDANQSVYFTIRSAYPLVRRGTLAADAALDYSPVGPLGCVFAGGTEVLFHQFPRLIERARWNGTSTMARFEPVGMVAQGTLSAAMPAQPVHASPGVSLTLVPGTVADFSGFLTRHLVASGPPPAAGPPTDLLTSGSGTGLPAHAGSLPEHAGLNPYSEWSGNVGGRIFFRALPAPRPGVPRPLDGSREYLASNSSYWYREHEQAVGWLSRGILAAEVDLAAGVLGVGKVKCAAQHAVSFRHFLHEFTSPPHGSNTTLPKAPPPWPWDSTGTTEDAHTIDERVHGYLAAAVTGGLVDAGMPDTSSPTPEIIAVPPQHHVAFQHDAMVFEHDPMSISLQGNQAFSMWLPAVRGLLIPSSVHPVADKPLAADADGDGYLAGEEGRIGTSDADGSQPGSPQEFLASALAALGPHVIHDERDADVPVGNGMFSHVTPGASNPAMPSATATHRYLSLIITHRGFPEGTRLPRPTSPDSLSWSFGNESGTLTADELHEAWLRSAARGQTLGGARPFWVLPLGLQPEGVLNGYVSTSSMRGDWLAACVLTRDTAPLAGLGGRFIAPPAGVPENVAAAGPRDPAITPLKPAPTPANVPSDSPLLLSPAQNGSLVDSDGDFSPDAEEAYHGTATDNPAEAPVILSSQAIHRQTWVTRALPVLPASMTSSAAISRGWVVIPTPQSMLFNQAPWGLRTWLKHPISPPHFSQWLRTTGPVEPFHDQSAFFVTQWNRLGEPTPSHGLPPHGRFDTEVDSPLTLRIPSYQGSPVEHEIMTYGFRYRLRGPKAPSPTSRQFLHLRWEHQIPLEQYWRTDLRNWPPQDAAPPITPTLVRSVALTIPANETYSEPFDIIPVPDLAISNTHVHMVRERLLPVEIKVTDFATKSDTVPYVATTNAIPPKNSELCLKADKTNEKARVEIELPSVTDTAMLSKLKWKVVQKPADTMVSEGVFGGATPPSPELSLGSGSSVEDEILFEVQVGADGGSFTPAAKMNVRVVRDRLNWWFEPLSSDFGWRTSKPEPRENTGDYRRKQILNGAGNLEWVPDPSHSDHHPNAYKRESLQSVYEFFKVNAPGIPPNFGSLASDAGQAKTRSWIKAEITCFAEFHEKLKPLNGNNPLIDLNSFSPLKLNQTLDLEGAAGPSNLPKVLKHLVEKQTKVTVSSSPLSNYTNQKGTWAKNAAIQIGDARLAYYDLLAFWQKEGSLGVRSSPEQTGALPGIGAPAPTTADEAKVIFVALVFWQDFGMDSLNPHLGAGADNIPDLGNNLGNAITHIQGQVDRLLGAGEGAAYFATLTASAVPATPGTYNVSFGESFYTFTLRLLGKMVLTDYWRPQGVVASYCNYNMGAGNFNLMIASLSSVTYPERARLGLEDWGWHYEVRIDEWANGPNYWSANKPGVRPNATRFWYFREIFKNLTTP